MIRSTDNSTVAYYTLNTKYEILSLHFDQVKWRYRQRDAEGGQAVVPDRVGIYT